MIGVKKKIKRGDFVDISHYKPNDLKIGYQGVKGSFSEEAMISFFGENNKSLNYEKFEDVFNADSLQEAFLRPRSRSGRWTKR